MITKKKVVMGLLALASAAVWVPALTAERGKAPRNADEGGRAEADSPGGTTVPPPSEPQPDAGSGETRGPDDPLGSVEPMIESLRNFRSQESQLPLDELASSWAPPSSAPGEGAPGRTRLDSFRDSELASEEVAAFLEEHRLAGILHSEDGSLALLGPRIVRVGQTLLEGALTVTDIQERAVELAHGDRSIRLELPPIRTRSQGRGEQEGDAEPAGDAPNSPSSPAGKNP